MSIKKRDGVYIVRLELGKGADGKRRQEYARFSTLAEAKRHEAKVLSAVVQGRGGGGPSKQTLGELVPRAVFACRRREGREANDSG